MNEKTDGVLIIGAGGAGLIAAWRSALAGVPTTVLERNQKPGIKLLISGGGKCNVTHAGTMEELLKAFLPREARFLKPSFYRFSNTDIIRLLEELGVTTYVRPNGRVFPVSSRAGDVVQALITAVQGAGAMLMPGARVESIERDNEGVSGVVVAGKFVPSRRVIVATGGMSYPKTGTTGDGLDWARALGHTIVTPRPALAPIGIDPAFPREWRGVALRGGCLSVLVERRKIARWCDDILFSHEGISGPAALELSRQAAEALERGPVFLAFDFFPQLEFSALDRRLNEQIQQQRGKMIGTILEAWLPNRLVGPLLRASGVDPEKRGHILTAEDRRAVVHMLKSWTIGRIAGINVERGEVTAGGVSLAEVDPRSMRSRVVRGLYLCGELLDIAGPVGGYNLQAAFSTGFVAGESAAGDQLAQHRLARGIIDQ
jgi:predicted Rossmann fold flavoprotein